MRLHLVTVLSVLSALATGCALPARTPAPGAIQSASFGSESLRYRCDGGGEIEVAYLNLTNGDSFAALHHGGRTALMQNRPTASGARYVALDEEQGLRWYLQGRVGALRFLAADHTAKEQPLLSGCKPLGAG